MQVTTAPLIYTRVVLSAEVVTAELLVTVVVVVAAAVVAGELAADDLVLLELMVEVRPAEVPAPGLTTTVLVAVGSPLEA